MRTVCLSSTREEKTAKEQAKFDASQNIESWLPFTGFKKRNKGDSMHARTSDFVCFFFYTGTFRERHCCEFFRVRWSITSPDVQSDAEFAATSDAV
jgi:hypothetical protein